jgi:dienelactone hydrolase
MRRTAIALALAVLLVVLVAVLAPFWTAATLIARGAGASGVLGTASQWTARDVSPSGEYIPTRSGAIRARIFRPAGSVSGAVLLVTGVHRDGINEPRLRTLAGELAAAGRVVVTPEIGDLLHYRVTSRVTDAIEDVAKWMTARGDLFGADRIGVIGVSFSGGLSIVASGRPSIRGQIAYVLSFGGHGNLPRVLRYLCTGEGGPQPPHPYGVAVLLHQSAERVVPTEQVSGLREALETFLDASAIKRTDAARAARLFSDLRSRASRMPGPSATLVTHLADGDVSSLGAAIAPHLDHLGQDAALSPDRSPPPIAPVYLLHGEDDNVIPARESFRLAEHLRPHTRVRALISGFLSHADVADTPGVNDTLNMIGFWKAVLAE